MSIKYVYQCKGKQNCHMENHLCQIVARRDLGRIKELIINPKYYCKNCGRAAHARENLCNPSKI